MKPFVFQRLRSLASDDAYNGWNDVAAQDKADALTTALSDITAHYIQVIVKSTITLFEKGTELAKDVIILGRFRVHPAVMVSLNVAVGTFSLAGAVYKSYHATKFQDVFDGA